MEQSKIQSVVGSKIGLVLESMTQSVLRQSVAVHKQVGEAVVRLGICTCTAANQISVRLPLDAHQQSWREAMGPPAKLPMDGQ